MSMADCDLYWLVGILEGEGSFVWTSGRKNRQGIRCYQGPRVQMSSIDRDVIEKISYITESKIHGPYSQKRNKPETPPMWMWYVGSAKALDLMSLLYPFMSLRRQQQIENVLRAIQVSGYTPRSSK